MRTPFLKIQIKGQSIKHSVYSTFHFGDVMLFLRGSWNLAEHLLGQKNIVWKIRNSQNTITQNRLPWTIRKTTTTTMTPNIQITIFAE